MKVINVFNTNSTYSFKINTSLNCGADYTVSAVVGRFRDLLQNNNQYSSNGICYNTSKFLSGKIKKEAVENFSIKTPNNERVFCVQQDTSISISTDFTNPEKYKYTWYKDGLIFLASGDYGENKSINVNSTGNFFIRARGLYFKEIIFVFNIIIIQYNYYFYKFTRFDCLWI